MKEEVKQNIETFTHLFEQLYTKNESYNQKQLNEWVKSTEKEPIDYTKEKASIIYQSLTQDPQYMVAYQKIAPYENKVSMEQTMEAE